MKDEVKKETVMEPEEGRQPDQISSASINTALEGKKGIEHGRCQSTGPPSCKGISVAHQSRNATSLKQFYCTPTIGRKGEELLANKARVGLPLSLVICGL
jgi:hypothetical protein